LVSPIRKCLRRAVRQEGFKELIGQVLNDTGLAPEYLELELTESLLLSIRM